MKKQFGYKQVPNFETICDRCGAKESWNDGLEINAVLKFDFTFNSSLDGFTSRLEFCQVCAEKIFKDLHKELIPESKEKYYDFRDDWWNWKDVPEGVLLISKEMEAIQGD
jgi:hypothetical protein